MTRLPALAAAGALLLAWMAPAPAPAMQILDGADHAELEAEVSATAVSRIALLGDRIARVVRSAEGFAAEHDPASGDLYLRPLDGEGERHEDPVTLFIGTERGFTYRLALTVADRGSAQILIRNAAADTPARADPGEPRVSALVRLVAAVARREPLAGYAVEAAHGGAPSMAGVAVIETWRGPRFTAHVVEIGRGAGEAADLAGTMDAVAVWLAAPGTGPSGGRLGVAVREGAGR